MNEEELNQNAEESAPEDSTGGTELDNLLGDTQDETSQEEYQPDESTLKEEKKQRDFEKAYFKAREEIKNLKSQMVTTKASPETVSNAPLATDEEKYLENLIAGTVRKVLNESQETSQTIAEIKSKPYFNVLEDKILEISKTLPSNISDKERLETAYQRAAADNLDLIVKTAVEYGQEAGFKNKTFKKAQGLIRPTPANGTMPKGDDLRQRFSDGSLSDEEYRELRADGTLDKWEQEELNI